MENLKVETRQRILQAIDNKYEVLSDLKQQHEAEIETLTQTIDSLQVPQLYNPEIFCGALRN